MRIGLFLIAAIALCGCQTPQRSDVFETAAVYRAVLNQYLGATRSINLARETSPLTVYPADLEACADGIEFLNLDVLRSRKHAISDDVAADPRVRLVDARQQRALIQQSDPMRAIQRGQSADEAVNSAFASGLLTLSEIAFDQSHRHAIVEYAFTCGMLCGHGGTFLLERDDQGDWAVSERQCGGGWMS